MNKDKGKGKGDDKGKDRLNKRGAGVDTTQKKGVRLSFDNRTPRRTAATYSPNWCVSTIGAHGLNFSVRYGKRWDPAAKATAIFYLRDYSLAQHLSLTRKISGY